MSVEIAEILQRTAIVAGQQQNSPTLVEPDHVREVQGENAAEAAAQQNPLKHNSYRRDCGTDCETPNRIVLDYTDGGEVILCKEILHRLSALIGRGIRLRRHLLLMHFEVTHCENPDYEQRRQNHSTQESYEPGQDRVALRNPSIARKSNWRNLGLYRGVALQMRHYPIADLDRA